MFISLRNILTFKFYLNGVLLVVPLLFLCSLINFCFAQDRLFYTDQEINIWKQRAGLTSGGKLYNSKGDAGTNTPNDWENILSNANRFVSNPLSELWDGNLSKSPYTKGIGMHDAAFVYLLTKETKYLDAVKQLLISQAGVAKTDFSTWEYLGDTKAFHEGDWISRLFYGYMFVRTAMSSSDRDKMDKWFKNAATYYANNVHEDLKLNFPNRLSGDYSVKKNVAQNGDMQNDYAYVNASGIKKNKLSWLSAWYNNRRFSQIRIVGLVGVMYNDANLINHAKTYVTEWLKYSVFPDGTMGEYQRNGNYGNPQNGMIYGSINTQVSIEIADLLARAGDVSLYEYTTSDGLHGTQGGSKNIYLTIQTYYKQIDKKILNYYGSVSETNRLDQISPTGTHWVNDIWFAKANIYYKDDYFKKVYTRTSGGVERFPSSGIGTAGPIRSPWGGSGGVLPGMLFMYGQMEGLVWPYADGKEDQTITFNQISDRFLSDGSFELAATSSSGLTVNFEVISGPAYISGNIINFTGVGEVKVRAYQGGNSSFRSAEATQSFIIKKKIKIGQIEDQILKGGSELTLDVAMSYGGIDESLLQMTVTSEDETLMPNANITVLGSGKNRIMSFKAPTGVEGSVKIIINATDGIADADAQSFNILIGEFTSSTLRLDAGLITGQEVYSDKTFVPMLPYLFEGEAFNSFLSTPIANTDTDKLYQNEIWGNTEVTKYIFPVNQGEYSIHLHFADWHYNNPGDRIMDILLEGEIVLDDFDIIEEVGKSAVVIRSFDKVIKDGSLELEIRNISGYSKISGVEILPVGEEHLAVETPDALNQVIDFESLGSVTIKDSPLELVATSSSGLPVKFQVISGPAVLTGNFLTLTDLGQVTVKAYQAGDESYLPADDVVRTFKVTEKLNLPKISDVIITQNETLGPLNLKLSYSGDINDLKISAESENTEIIPDGNIIIQRSGNNFNLTLTPGKDLTGLSKITVDVSDDSGASKSQSFNVLVEEEQKPTVANLRLDAGLIEGESTYEGKLFEPLLPYLTKGTTYSTHAYWITDVLNTENDGLYQTELWWEADTTLNFEFPLEPGEYTVHLHLIDLYSTKVGDKLMDVVLQNEKILNNYDIVLEAGTETAVIKSFDVTLATGDLKMEFYGVIGFDQISGIEILPKGEEPLKLLNETEDINNSPVINDIDEPLIQEGATMNVAVTATDIDGDEIVLSIDSLPNFVSFIDDSGGKGTILVSPSYEDEGTYELTVVAKDDREGESRLDFKIQVVDLSMELKITSFTLVNGDTDEDIKVLSEGDTIKYSEIGTKNINIRANVDERIIDRVDFSINQINTIANTVPFNVFNADTTFNYSDILQGYGTLNILEAIPYKTLNKTSTYTGTKSGISFYIDTDFPDFQVDVYPNPSEELFNFSVNQWSDSGMYFSLYDISGKIFINEELDPSQRHNLKLYMHNSMYKAGLYIFKIYSADGTLSTIEKITKK
ncbi:malectin domain-containing carbohydrate-binding protein [Chondrinema litorale]|uniref:malectin domain-containing carbohydrate-binding protein n=1 Tax=Chondrinema litorale TaxID=2994555 RepID=UPI002542987A|nr:malectin domain-containing carbohydrate-binding protein [Chondrinema litorale]UZR93210.1 malectin domain-containing carbohydrate-binding protein [Chondrinema litorale]